MQLFGLVLVVRTLIEVVIKAFQLIILITSISSLCLKVTTMLVNQLCQNNHQHFFNFSTNLAATREKLFPTNG